MVVRYDTDDEEFVVDPDECEDCGEPLYFTGCDAPGCNGFSCTDCATGCDLEMLGDEGRCARAIAAEPDEDRQARSDAERAAWGLA